MRYNCPQFDSHITFIVISEGYIGINIVSKPLMLIRILLPFISPLPISVLLYFTPCLFRFKHYTRNYPLLNIAKPKIKPLERSKPKRQVPIAKETVNTTKGGTK
ncbi:hypothetical protein [Sphingobacterium anhuiense]|uniref:Uncharacterized protein n=1 Tax=Sphingobacterium anhuiense TaxID=493780 RepID=A0ABW5Z0C3_9SPHI